MRARPALLAAVLAALAGVGLAAPPTHADTPAPTPTPTTTGGAASPTPAEPAYSPKIAVSITGVSPEVLTADDAVTVTGTLLNKTDHPISDVTVVLETTSLHYISRADLQAARVAPQILGLHSLPGSPGDDVGTLLPDLNDATVPQPFTITVAHGKDLGLGEDAVSPLAVVATTPDEPLGVGRDLVNEPYFPNPADSRVGVSLVIPFTEQPDWTVANPTGTTLGADLAPGGRLTSLLGAIYDVFRGAASQYPKITLAVDPALLTQVNALAADTALSAALQAAAQSWSRELTYLARIDAVTISALPYGDADLASLGSSGLSGARGDGVRLLQSAAPELTQQLGGGLANPVSIDPVITQDLRMAPATVNVAAAAGAGLAVVSPAQLPATVAANPDNTLPIPPTPTDVAQIDPAVGALVGTPNSVNPSAPRLPALVTDDAVQSLLRATAQPAYAQRASAEVLAELGMITSEAPSARPEFGGHRGVTMVAPRDWAPPPAEVSDLLQGLGSAKWLTMMTPQENLRTNAPIAAYPDRGPATDLDQPDCQAPDSIPAAEALRPNVSALADLLDPPTTSISAPLGDALDRSLSTFWRLQTKSDCSVTPDTPAVALAKLIAKTLPKTQATALQTGVYATFHTTIGKLSVQVAKKRVLTGPSGALPVDVSNFLGQTVRLKLTLIGDSSDDGQSTIVGVPLFITLPGNTPDKPQVEMQVTTRRLGSHMARVVVSTASGKYLFTAKTVNIRSTSYGIVSVGITAGALTVLLLAFVVRGVRWLRRRRTS